MSDPHQSADPVPGIVHSLISELTTPRPNRRLGSPANVSRTPWSAVQTVTPANKSRLPSVQSERVLKYQDLHKALRTPRSVRKLVPFEGGDILFPGNDPDHVSSQSIPIAS